jgi:hypothetical protein
MNNSKQLKRLTKKVKHLQEKMDDHTSQLKSILRVLKNRPGKSKNVQIKTRPSGSLLQHV